jgi:hypothetical protein
LEEKKKLIWLIVISSLLRIILASAVEFGNVEAYYWVLANKLQWNYFDHPPMVAWLIRLTTANLAIHEELFVRMGAIICAGCCTWIVYEIGVLVSSKRAGWLTALLYSSSIYSGINIAAFILPDSPQMVFWLAALYMLLRTLRQTAAGHQAGKEWCLFGLLTGLCIMSKVHGVFLWIGALSYLVFFARSQFKNFNIYLALAITVIIISPIFIWNIQHDFITYRFHSGRVTLQNSPLDLGRFLKQLFQVIVSTGPIHIFLIGNSLYRIVKGRWTAGKISLRIILCCSLPMIAILLTISLFREILPHWPGPAISTLLILPGVYLSGEDIVGVTPRLLKWALGYALFIALCQILVINYTPGTMSPEKEGMKIGSDEESIDMYGWKFAGLKFDSLYKRDVAVGDMPVHAPLIVTHWIPAAHVDFYLAQPTGLETYGLGSVFDLHQYVWLNKSKRPLLKGDSAYYVIPSNLFTFKDFNRVLRQFDNYEFALIVPVYRSGLLCKQYYIMRLEGYKGGVF